MASSTRANIYTGAALALITTMIWSGNYVIARGINKQLPPVSIGFYRWSLATICLAPFAFMKFFREKETILQHKQYIFWTALTGVTIFNTFIYLAGHYAPAITLALIGTTAAPIFATILAAFFLREKVSVLRIGGMIICFVGIIFLLSKGSFEQLSQFQFGKGEVLVLISALSFAVYNTLVKKKPVSISPLAFLFVVFALGTICLAPFYLYELIHEPAVRWTMNMFSIIVYLGIGNSIIAFFCWNTAIAKMGASNTALFSNLIPVFSTIEAILFLGEKFEFIHLVSGVLVVTGLIIANLKQAR